MDDLSLLKAYDERQDQDAFAQLVRRHGGWLHSAARRQLLRLQGGVVWCDSSKASDGEAR